MLSVRFGRKFGFIPISINGLELFVAMCKKHPYTEYMDLYLLKTLLNHTNVVITENYLKSLKVL